MMIITIKNVIDFVSNLGWRDWYSTAYKHCYDVDMYSKYKWINSGANLRISKFQILLIHFYLVMLRLILDNFLPFFRWHYVLKTKIILSVKMRSTHDQLTFKRNFVFWKSELIAIDSRSTHFFLKFEIKKTIVTPLIRFKSYDKWTKQTVSFFALIRPCSID